MELVLLSDTVASYGSLWIRVANTQGLSGVQIKDRFREQGFGEGAEELEVEGIDLSPVGGASRIFFRRAANNTTAEVHRLGAVMLQTNTAYARVAAVLDGWNMDNAVEHVATGAVGVSNQPSNVNGAEIESPEPVKRGRGRPKGAKNKPKPPLQRVAVPTWPNV